MPKSVSWDRKDACMDSAAAAEAAAAQGGGVSAAGVTPGISSGSLPEEPSIYLEQTMSTADTRQDWRGVLQLQELSFDSMMPSEMAGGMMQQRTTMQQLLAAHQGAAAAAAAGGLAPGQCPFGHGRTAAAPAAAGDSSLSLNGMRNHEPQ
jgi:hypothetical protein